MSETMNVLSKATNQRSSITPQSSPMPGRTDMVKNHEGGYVFSISDKSFLERFLILGTTKGTYYVTGATLTNESMKDLAGILKSDGHMFVNTIVEVSTQARAANNDYALLALAYAISNGGEETRQHAARVLPEVARTGTHLFHFIRFALGFRGWGKLMKWAVKNWYASKSTKDLAYQMVKYQSRDGWSHRDVLRVTHQNVGHNPDRNMLFKWATRGLESSEIIPGDLSIIQAFEEAKTASTGRLVQLITDHGLSHEMIPTEAKNSPEVWEALAQSMGATALVRNLNKMTAIGLIKPLSAFSKLVTKKLADEQYLKRGKIHPIALLNANRQYRKGHGDKGSLTWAPDTQIIKSLEDAFYLAFKTVEPTGKNYLLALDVSSSMKGNMCVGANLTAAEGAAAMAMVTARVEPWCHIIGFDHKIRVIDITANDTLDSALTKIYKGTFGSTDCAKPMLYAAQNKLDVDLFSVYTDNETHSGSIHPREALRDYRKLMDKPQAKNVVVGMSVSRFSIADPLDRHSLDVVGFDANAPAVISEFSKQVY